MTYDNSERRLIPCGANDRCLAPNDPDTIEQFDPYGIYGGRWHDSCWDKFGYGNFKFDAAYAGESLEEEDY
jgi:hypothetical protein